MLCSSNTNCKPLLYVYPWYDYMHIHLHLYPNNHERPLMQDKDIYCPHWSSILHACFHWHLDQRSVWHISRSCDFPCVRSKLFECKKTLHISNVNPCVRSGLLECKKTLLESMFQMWILAYKWLIGYVLCIIYMQQFFSLCETKTDKYHFNVVQEKSGIRVIKAVDIVFWSILLPHFVTPASLTKCIAVATHFANG